MKSKIKVICLIGPSQHHFSTVSTLIKSGVNVCGVVVADSNKSGINFKYLNNAIKKLGIYKVIGQIIERIIYKIFNSKKDKNIYNSLFNVNDKKFIKKKLGHKVLSVESYSEKIVLEFIKNSCADVLVIHTPFWVPKKVRDLVSGRVIGAHPGITQHYRGIHSPFWAIYNNDYKNIGFTIFWVNNLVDGGDIIYQGNIVPEKNDSYITLSWKGMKMISIKMADNILKVSSVSEIKSHKYGNYSDDTIYYHPTIFNYLKYRINSNFR